MIQFQVVSVSHVSSSTAEERAQVDRILADPLFSQSKRCASFLRFVTERALNNTQEPLTERTLGVEIFGRSPNYDTDADPIVRVTASEVRKRLAQYYDDPPHSGELRVLVHKGSYAAEFVAPGVVPPPSETRSPSAAPAPAPSVLSARKRRWYYIAGLIVAGIATAAVIRVARPQPTAFDQFWAPVMDGPQVVLLAVPQFSDHVHLVGVDNPTLTWTDPLTPVPDHMGVSWSVYSGRLVHVADLSVACRLSEFFGSKGKRVLVKGEHELSMRDLRESPAVILGGLTNQWTSRLLPEARFTFGGEGTLRFIRDRLKPENREWKFDAKVPSGDREKDLIIISRVADSMSGRITVLAGGFSAWGTEAAVELITDPNQMQKVLANVPTKWDARNVQIALECTVVKRESGMPRFLAAHYW